ncbi:MAG: hypothetical protein KatS3mg105_4858 [Gemmatales bacterium]|nr:MAG: hypothetical protein KatS3mg105_4858 [Gemmatales bacterium]
MKRILTRVSFFCLSLALFASGETVDAQSTKKALTGPEMNLGGMKSKTSGKWKADKPEKPELYRYIMPKSFGDKVDAILTVVEDPSKKSADALISEWKAMFKPPKGKTIDSVASVQKVKIGNADIAYFEVHGTYLKKNADGETQELPNYRMYVARLDTGKNVYIVKAVGPYNTMTFHKIDFKSFLASFK